MSTPNTHFGASKISRMLKNCRSIYFIGIGGVSMSSLACISQLRGYRTGGSDRTETDVTRRLADGGIEVYYTHEAAHLDGYDAVVYTVAISPENPEYKSAVRRGMPCISRADYLGYIMTGYECRIGISGMHGKSTCTSMCALACMDAGANPTVLSGAELEEMGGANRIGGEKLFIFEACEYMDSFLDFNPTVAVILNIEMDHVDYFSSIAQIRRSFAGFAAITGEEGYAVVNADDENVMIAMHSYAGHLITFSTLDSSADWYAANIVFDHGRPAFDAVCCGKTMAHITLSVPGRHNVYNALATIAAAAVAGIPPAEAARGLARFHGARRRTEYKGKLCGADVYDDYGHHPTEIKTTVEGIKGLGYDRVWCVFQPHTYSRTAKLRDYFVTALRSADVILLADIYAARETETYGVSSAQLAEMVGDKARYCKDFGDVAEILNSEARPGDAVLVMGAGDIYKLFPMLELK